MTVDTNCGKVAKLPQTLEVGKKYKKCASPGIEWIRIDVIRTETDIKHPIAITIKHVLSNMQSKNVSTSYFNGCTEYKEPKLCIGPEHVGRRVRLRNGDVTLILSYSPVVDSDLTIETSNHYYHSNGLLDTRYENSMDIVEVLP